jgi:hypothetical protein
VSTTAFLTCLAAQCSGPSAFAMDTAYGDNSATASNVQSFFILVNIHRFDVFARKPIRFLLLPNRGLKED